MHCPRSYSKQACPISSPPPPPTSPPRSSPSWGWPLEGTAETLPLKPIVLRGCPQPTPKVKSNCLWDNGPSLPQFAKQFVLSSCCLGNNSVGITARFPVLACGWRAGGHGSWGGAEGNDSSDTPIAPSPKTLFPLSNFKN